MRIFTVTQIKEHFNGVPYSSNPVFIGLLVRNKILVRTDVGKYTYNLNMLSADVIQLVSDECRRKQLTYNRKYYDNFKSRK